ncbi:hypothetical protein HPP92_028178 [Vanilla planifolia]|uniref:Guanylate kinase-like domain-containing protein n=1 Tax=Vanilla planifolia TaxID=51239 RepID=A0A835P8V6_VANPL|nr:hypothetical protein HPP92_028178 [Vanilla planifolia]
MGTTKSEDGMILEDMPVLSRPCLFSVGSGVFLELGLACGKSVSHWTSGQDVLLRGLEALGSPSVQTLFHHPGNPMRLQEVREGVHFVVTATSRAQRPGEVDGKDYYFVSKEEFFMIERNELIEYALVYGDYKEFQNNRDFMAKGYDIVLRVDVQGAAT